MRDDAQEVQRIDVLRLDREDLAIDRLGFIETSSLMMLDGDLDGLVGRDLGHGWHDVTAGAGQVSPRRHKRRPYPCNRATARIRRSLWRRSVLRLAGAFMKR